jgi:hypothetical protein
MNYTGSPIGLGDTVGTMLTIVGADKLADCYKHITGHDCGCAQRKEYLNKLFPYNVSDITEKEGE